MSGGCVERAVAQQAQTVFASGEPTLMEYDGRYRLGCNGTLFIFLERVQPANAQALWNSYQCSYQTRRSLTIATTYQGPPASQGSLLVFARQNLHYLNGQSPVRQRTPPASAPLPPGSSSVEVFVQVIYPAPQLYVIGSEADAMHLSTMATQLGWQVTLVTHPRSPVGPQDDIPNLSVAPEALPDHLSTDERTAVVLMTHSYGRDLAYLISLLRFEPFAYLGLLGPSQRRDSLLGKVLERTGELPDWLDERLYAPTGIDLGAELPAEVALSVLAEIKAILTRRPVPSLRDKQDTIHQSVNVSL